MWRHTIVALTFVLPAASQFSDIAVTDDGSQLYFSTPLRLGESAPSRPESRVFRLTTSGIELFAERGELASTSFRTSGEGAGRVQVSGDGRRVAITLVNVCPSGDTCLSPLPSRGELRGERAQVLGEGSVQLSRNGRWALLTPPAAPEGNSTATLIDLETNTRTATPSPVLGLNAFAVTSGGAVLVQPAAGQGAPPGFGIWKQGQVTAVPLDGPSRPLGLSDDGGVLIYAQLAIADGELRLFARQIASGADSTLFTVKMPQSIELLGLANDGRRVLFRTVGPEPEGAAYVADTASGEVEPIALDEGEMTSAGTLGGGGDFAVIATTAGRVVKVALAQGKPGRLETIIPTTPYILTSARGYAPGSRTRLRGALPAVKESLAGRILLDTIAVPILLAGRGEIVVQIPWELRIGEVPLRLDLPSDSPFRQSELVFAAPYAPEILPADPGETSLFGLKIVKGDWSGLVNAMPGPGEIVHAYFTGLGAVTGQISTGAPAPAQPPLPIQASLKCRFLPYTTYAETLFAGLAPGMIGIYQVSFRMPDEPAPPRMTGMGCEYSGPFGSGGFGLFSFGAP